MDTGGRYGSVLLGHFLKLKGKDLMDKELRKKIFLIKPLNFSFFSIIVWGIDLDYCDLEWFALEMNRDHSVIFEIATKYCISVSFVDYEGYSISSKGFFSAVVDAMVI